MSIHPHTPSQGQVASAIVELANERDAIDALEDQVLAALAAQNYPEASRFAVRLALEEALINAFRHGHATLPADTTVKVEYRISPAELLLKVTDKGPGFKMEAVPDCTLEENLERPSGRGLMLMRAFMTAVHHENNGSTVVMTYSKPAE